MGIWISALARSCLFLAILAPGFGQDYRTLVRDADRDYRDKAYTKAENGYRAAFALSAGTGDERHAGALYNAACCAALAGNPDVALSWLQLWQEKEHNYANPSHLERDHDLFSLHGDPRWKNLIEQTRAAWAKTAARIDKPLEEELTAVYHDDQCLRLQLDAVEKAHGSNSREMQDLWKAITDQDKADLAKVAAVLDKDGWLGPEKVGWRGNTALFLVIQHADLETQEEYLPMMRAAVKAGHAEPGELALLEDRVALGEGRRQTYGSQIGRDPLTGRFYIRSLEDPEHVDQRRAAVGLQPLADYVSRWNIAWDPAAYKKRLPMLDRLDGIGTR